jgi:membrane-associated PAP2 superfamily phosphatase
MRNSVSARPTWLALACLPLLLLWDASALDLPVAAWFGDAGGFALKEHWLFSAVLHSGARLLAWAVVLVATLMVWWPRGVFLRIEAARRVQFVATALCAVLAISLLKMASSTSCPWDLATFGGAAQHVSHWSWGGMDGGSGRCFPAGHASAGFAFVAGFFAFNHDAPRVARVWLAGALAFGLVLGLAQQVRGAHFMSHTLWTAWICWVIALALDRPWPWASIAKPEYAIVAGDASIP